MTRIPPISIFFWNTNIDISCFFLNFATELKAHDREVLKQLLCEYDFFWNIENEIQPEWYKPKLDEKRKNT